MLTVKSPLTPVPWLGVEDERREQRKGTREDLGVGYDVCKAFFFFSKALFFKLGGGYCYFWCLFMCLKRFLIF